MFLIIRVEPNYFNMRDLLHACDVYGPFRVRDFNSINENDNKISRQTCVRIS